MPDYATMEAGAEMDALVAEKAMGLTEKDWDPPCFWYHQTDSCERFDKHDWMGWCYDCHQSVDEVAREPRRYSRDLLATGEVVGAMKARHQKRLVLKEYTDGWYAAFGKRLDDTLWQATQCDTAPLAICRAALMAVRKGTDDGEH